MNRKELDWIQTERVDASKAGRIPAWDINGIPVTAQFETFSGVDSYGYILRSLDGGPGVKGAYAIERKANSGAVNVQSHYCRLLENNSPLGALFNSNAVYRITAKFIAVRSASTLEMFAGEVTAFFKKDGSSVITKSGADVPGPVVPYEDYAGNAQTAVFTVVGGNQVQLTIETTVNTSLSSVTFEVDTITRN